MGDMWELQATNLAAVTEAFDRLAAELGTATFLNGTGKEIVHETIRRHFAQGGDPEWPDITAKSRAQRKVNQESGPLIDSGALMEAASDVTGSVEGSLFQIDGQTLTVGTDKVQAAVQQFGWADKNIPARPYEDLTIEDEIRLKTAMEDDWLHQLLAAW